MSPNRPDPSDLPELDPRHSERQQVDLATRLKFLGLAEEDAARLRQLAPMFEAKGQDFVDRFYDHLIDFRATAVHLQQPELVRRLKHKQLAHLRSMLAAEWGPDYVEERLHVGDRHADVGIEPQYFLGAYSAYLQFSLGYLAERHGEAAEVLEQLSSMIKAVFLDIGLTLDAYFLRSTQSLRQALDMLWKANSELRQFAQLTSHDLKTPLATVANLCDEALDEFRDQMPAAACELIAAAQQRSYRMSAMIDELLAITTFDENAEASATISVDAVVDEALERMQPLAQQRDVKLVVVRPLPSVWGNQVRLREAFYNLLSNAVKFVEPNRGVVEVRGEALGDRCRIVVADNGPGIPPEEHDRIFSPFRRLPTHRNRPGSGLGLYFTKTLIEQEGGRIWVESEPGHGARFIMELPRRPL